MAKGNRLAGSVSVDISGLPELRKAMDSLRASVQRRILRKALTNAARPGVKATAAKIQKVTGHLAKSIGLRTKTGRDKAVNVVVGPRRKFYKIYDVRTTSKGTQFVKMQKTPKDFKEMKALGKQVRGDKTKAVRWATKYFHLVELGTKRSRKFSPLQKTFNELKSSMNATVEKEVAAGLAAEARKVVK